MYKLFSAIDQVSTDQVVERKAVVEGVSSTLDLISADTLKISAPTMFTVKIEGTTVSPEFNITLKYDGYYRNTDVRIDTEWDGMAVSKAINNEAKDETYVESLRYTHFAELTSGNMLPFTTLDVNYLEQLEKNTKAELFTAKYEMLNNEKVLYIKSSIRNGTTTEFWYSPKYKIPMKFYEVSTDAESKGTVEWEVVSIDENAVLTDETFYIPEGLTPSVSVSDYYGAEELTGTTRGLLLYEVSSIEIEEKGLMDMTQILYYSTLDFDELTEYFVNLMKDSSGYSLDNMENKSIIEGTVNNDTVIVIVNDHKTSENNTVNGININYYE